MQGADVRGMGMVGRGLGVGPAVGIGMGSL